MITSKNWVGLTIFLIHKFPQEEGIYVISEIFRFKRKYSFSHVLPFFKEFICILHRVQLLFTHKYAKIKYIYIDKG